MRQLTSSEVETFRRDGYLLLPGFYERARIDAIRNEIRYLIEALAETFALPSGPPTSDAFDALLPRLIAHAPEAASRLYDVVKKIPSFIRWATDPHHEELTKVLLGARRIGFANRGWGMRMDHPNHDETLTQLHQDYVSQLCSQRGVVFWTPLHDVDAALGPVRAVF